MITYKKGDMLAAPVEALVNTVNTVGVMGKGIALQFKERFPENYKAYVAAVKRGEVVIGTMFVTTLNRMDQLRFLINFPTKQHWTNHQITAALKRLQAYQAVLYPEME